MMGQPRWVSRETAVSRRVISEGKINKVVDYYGGASPYGGVQAYLVAQRNYVTRPHFHPADQFQILYGAPGSLFGTHPVGDLSVHYADAYTVYGPLVSGDPPLRYFTLRAKPTEATVYMPEGRKELRGPRGRSQHCEVRAPTAARLVPLLGQAEDGLSVGLFTAPAQTEVMVPDPGLTGQFLFVVSGSIHDNDQQYSGESISWHAPESPCSVGTAGTEGVSLLLLRFPLRDRGDDDDAA